MAEEDINAKKTTSVPTDSTLAEDTVSGADMDVTAEATNSTEGGTEVIDSAEVKDNADEHKAQNVTSETEEKSEQAAQLEQEAQRAVEQHNISHKYRIIAISTIFAIIVIMVVTAFGWPGWARQEATSGSSSATGQESVVTATPVALPKDASALVKILPDTVGSYARGEVKETTVWKDSEPVEEYEVTYTTGDNASEIKITFAQWTSADYAKAQYDSLISGEKGAATASGKVRVGDSETGSYEVHADASDSAKSVILWNNDTTVFQAIGPKNAVNNFYSSFPY
ncbi:hypothetical protein EJ419_03015 [Alloscardovia theropitheci]|uniref:Uncharacterized protein n=1 Tax=Alloscardovia theropitheci TaxID=2496842 RepID=A0A4R0QXS4_9BIFI|nr:hypothetical protein [Alloscardovia theropitheci]TCD54460.1 hypothetical protein EJ419_03015 [Alloscardovia theropitheci]